jgi:multicomponent Na+:H+ antiporter subunit G
METLVTVASWAALIAGGIFYLIGAIGLNRMPDFFARMHAVSVSETLGAGLLIVGMLIQAGPTLVAVKLIIILLVLLTTGSVATHALARAALHDGEKPLIAGDDGKLEPSDPDSLFPGLGARLAAPLRSETVEQPEEEPSKP